jgi:hypothetical protein
MLFSWMCSHFFLIVTATSATASTTMMIMSAIIAV